MRTNRANAVLRYIRRLAAVGYAPDLADRELLNRFVTDRDEMAYAVLVRRHGPMVLRLCLRVLHNEHDAEDAFQATFLVLSQKAASLLPQESLGGWLYKVAYRISQKVRIENARRHKSEGRATVPQAADPLGEMTLREAKEILDKELARLPDKFRVPLVLCYLEGLTRDEAAKQLGLPPSTLKGRLEQARDRLRARLAARGLALGGALVVSIFSEGTALSAVPGVLLDSTVEAATAVAAGGVAASVVPAHIAALAEGVMKAMFMTKLKIALAVLFTMVSFGAAVRMAQVKAAGPAPDDNAAPQGVIGASGAAVQQGPNDGALRQQLQQMTWFVAHVDAAANTITVQLQPPIAITFTRSGTSASGPEVVNARAVKELERAENARLRIVARESGTSAVAPSLSRVVLGPSLLLKLGVAANAEVIIDGQPGSLADLQATSMQVSLQLAQDQPIITRLEAITPGKVIVKAVDIENKMITVSAAGQDWTATLAADAKIMGADNQEAQLSDLSTGMRASVSLGVDKDQIVIQAIRVSGE